MLSINKQTDNLSLAVDFIKTTKMNFFIFKAFFNGLKINSIKRNFLFIVLYFIVLIVVNLFLLNNEYNFRNHLIFTNNSANKIAKIIEVEIDCAKYQMNYMANQIAYHGLEQSFIKKIFLNSNNQEQYQDLLTMSSWVDKNNELVINSIHGNLKQKINLNNRKYLEKNKKYPNHISVASPVVGEISKKKIIPITMGVANKESKYLGSIIFGFNIDSLRKKILNNLDSKNFAFLILTEDDELILKSDNYVEELYESKNNQVINDCTVLEEKNLFSKIFSHSDIICVNKVGNYPVKIFVKAKFMPNFYEDSLLKSSLVNNKFYKLQLVIIFSFIIFAIIFLHFLIIKPITKLSKSVKSILQNRQVVLKNPAIIEISELAKALMSLQKLLQNELTLKKELKIAKNKAERAGRSKIQFIGQISHDIKNHIFAVSGLVDLIKNELAKPNNINDCQKIIELIKIQILSLRHFVEDINNQRNILVSRLSIGELKYNQINNLIKDLPSIFQGQLQSDEISINLSLQEDMPELLCDIKRLKQIMINLVSNSIKYSNANTVINISTDYDRKNKKFCISIKDSGIGMSEEEIKLLLSGEGYNIKKIGLRKSFKSQGVGMNNVKKLVELHRGKMEIISKKQLGTTINLYFENDDQFIDIKALEGNKIESHHLIINIDDNKINLMMNKKKVEKLIEDSNCDITGNGYSGIEMIKSKNYNLILLDIDMPEMDGYEVAVKIREFNRHIPIVAYSTKSFDEVNRFIKYQIINDYISKEAGNNEFIATINRWLSKNSNKFIDYCNIIGSKGILIADDERVNLLVIKKYLQSFGCNVIAVSNGEELINQYRNNPQNFDAIISDIEMPELKGDDAITKIRKYNQNIVAIAITGNNNPDYIIKVLNSGFNDYFIKGTNQEFLLMVLAKQFSKTIEVFEQFY